MNVSLTPELEKFVAENVSTGRYSSASEVVRAGLRALEEDERWKAYALDRISRGMDDLASNRIAAGAAAMGRVRSAACLPRNSRG